MRPKLKNSEDVNVVRSEAQAAKPVSGLGLLRCAASAIWAEVLGFRFGCPWEVVPEAGPKNSFHYYLYSDSLSWADFRLDSEGIPRTWSRLTGSVYFPGDIAWYGLVNLEHYLRYGKQRHLDIFLRQVDWLEHHAVLRRDKAVVWHMNFDYLDPPVLLRAPWISSREQGLVISALVRGYRITRRSQLLELLKKSSTVFELDVEYGGVRNRVGRHVLYDEKPGYPAPGILDGFLTSLLGLYDLSAETGDSAVRRLFDQGIDGLKHSLPEWDYRKKWSWYGSRSCLSNPCYHHINRLLLTNLARLTKDPSLVACAERWNPDRLSLADRVEIYTVFQIMKNVARVRHRTWRLSARLSEIPQPVLRS